MQVQKNSILKISNYELLVHLGVSKNEKEKKQKVLLSIEVYFATLPKASITDNIKDTICYNGICDGLEDFNGKTFNTIEGFAHKVFTFLNNISKPNHLKLQVDKFPDIKNLKGSVSFSIDSLELNGI